MNANSTTRTKLYLTLLIGVSFSTLLVIFPDEEALPDKENSPRKIPSQQNEFWQQARKQSAHNHVSTSAPPSEGPESKPVGEDNPTRADLLTLVFRASEWSLRYRSTAQAIAKLFPDLAQPQNSWAVSLKQYEYFAALNALLNDIDNATPYSSEANLIRIHAAKWLEAMTSGGNHSTPLWSSVEPGGIPDIELLRIFKNDPAGFLTRMQQTIAPSYDLPNATILANYYYDTAVAEISHQALSSELNQIRNSAP